jgi:putative methyltransferase (TIGR04325 family)
MTPLSSLHSFVDAISDLPGINKLVQSRYEQAFRDNTDKNLFRGVYASFDEAQQSAPSIRPLGYDNADAAKMYIERTKKIHPTDYPVMFWLDKLFAQGCSTVFDLGGHIGVSYYAYRRYLTYPAQLKWGVHDVPAVMAEGKRFAAEKDKEQRLQFHDHFDEASGVDILFALGSLQYLPETLDSRLALLSQKPKHLLLNLTPLHDKHSYFTLQSIGTAFCPYRVTAVPAFLKGIEGQGYRLINHWQNPDKKCEIPFHAEYSLDHYHGFLFSLE